MQPYLLLRKAAKVLLHLHESAVMCRCHDAGAAIATNLEAARKSRVF